MKLRTYQILLSILRYIILNIWFIVILLPIVWVLISSFKVLDEVFKFSIPSKIILDNYIIPFSKRPYFRYYLNSLIFALGATLSNLFFCSLAGYGFAKFKFWGRKVLFFVVLSTMMLSIHVIMVPLFIMINHFKWDDTFRGLFAPFLVTAFGVFLMRQNMRSIPDDYIEAARIDGMGEFRIYAYIILPLSQSILATLGVLNFVGFWDEFLWPLIVATTTKTRTISVGISLFITAYRSPINQMAAVCVTAMTPILIAYLIAQRHFIQSLTITGLKE